MGMNPKSADHFFNILRAVEMRNFNEISVCILGNQNMRSPSHTVLEYNYRTFKRLLVGHGFGRVESIDVNGKDNSLRMDFSKPIPQELVGQFDVVHNSGTTEHILHNQWQTFKNIHDLLKPSGVMFHGFNAPGQSLGHGFWFYNEEYFQWLAKNCSYKIIDVQIGMTEYFRFSNRKTFYFTIRKLVNSKFVVESAWHDPPCDVLGFDNFIKVIGMEYDAFVIDRLNR